VAGIEPTSDTAGIVYVDTEKARFKLDVTIGQEAPHMITGLRFGKE